MNIKKLEKCKLYFESNWICLRDDKERLLWCCKAEHISSGIEIKSIIKEAKRIKSLKKFPDISNPFIYKV